MPRVMINGLVWCKNEDKMLKTTVKKHEGENQWDLVASLLSGKTDTQCKARWATGVDPSVKTIHWTREENEKLMYLEKIMSNKRDTTAPMIEHPTDEYIGGYNYSWYKGRKETEKTTAANNNPESFDSPRSEAAAPPRTTTLEISREKEENYPEILAEQARLRLANTRSKKKKRFAREKEMAVIRRLKHHRRMIEKKRSERKRSATQRTDTSFYDSSTTATTATTTTTTKRTVMMDDSRFFEEAIERRRENDDVAIESLDNDETSKKRSKVLVVPVPQYSYHSLHAFHFATTNYQIFRRCDDVCNIDEK